MHIQSIISSGVLRQIFSTHHFLGGGEADTRSYDTQNNFELLIPRKPCLLATVDSLSGAISHNKLYLLYIASGHSFFLIMASEN